MANDKDPVLALPAGQVHVWWSQVVVDPGRLAIEHALLNEEERQRAARFIVEPPRHSFITAHALIRRLVERYSGTPARAVRFVSSTRGKPSLADPGMSWLRFNLSHSGDVVVAALARQVDLGVDVEVLRSLDDPLSLARRFFAPAEAQALAALSGQQRSEAFLRCWTCKEAYLKAVGTGIGAGLSAVEVAVGSAEPQRVVSLDGSEREAGAWSLYQREPRPGTIITVAVPGRDWRIEVRQAVF